ncbi:aminopeptidase [Ahniella affigens]|uniref:Carboxypeptidase Q n=1 Tax=Ahniella affigens TaxID=2021234 RepID=A0A2P1PQ42_9GAMM|nr:M20/M25/M40 family metallo-hydrolase [Ahniella affigens]AVP96967.1 aminopeptidase [Ahniella affigens]
MRLLTAALLCLPVLAAQAETPSTLLSPELKAQAASLQAALATDDTAYHLVESLTTEVGARVAGSEADARAVAWAEKHFKQLGFDKVTLEPVRFPVWRRGDIRISVLGDSPQSLHAIALGWSKSTPEAGLSAEVVAFDDLDALSAASPEQLQGKIAYVSARMEKRRNGGDYGRRVAARSSGAEIAASKGAVALLIRSIGTDSDRLPHTGMGIWLGGIKPGTPASDRAMVLSNGERVALTAVPAAALSNPDADQLSRLLKLQPKLKLHYQLAGQYVGEYTSHNVVGEITGSTKPEEIIVVGGHLDSWDVGTGAIDDGAGVAITAAAVAAIKKQGLRPARTLRVVAFANEEQGVWGGKAYARAHAAELANHVGAAESDFGAGRIYRIDAGVPAKDWPLVQEIQAALDPLNIELGGQDAGGGADLSGMRDAGVPMFELLQDGTDYFDLHHTDNDTLDKIDPAALRQNVQAYATFLWLLGNAPQRVQTNFVPTPTP